MDTKTDWKFAVFSSEQEKVFMLEQLLVKDTNPFLFKFLTPEKKSIEQHFITWKKVEKYAYFM